MQLKQDRENRSILTSIFLTLWKRLDMLFPGHQWLEAVPVDERELDQQIRAYKTADLTWCPNEDDVRRDIEAVQALIRSDRDSAWLERVAALRDRLLDIAVTGEYRSGNVEIEVSSTEITREEERGREDSVQHMRPRAVPSLWSS